MTSQQTQAEQNKAIARRFFEEIVNAKRLGVADEIFAPDHTYHDPSSPMIGSGPEGQK
jgi:predicted SnoaL-like aldol condensation-catalyzing enzyme